MVDSSGHLIPRLLSGACVSNIFEVADMGRGDFIVPDETFCQVSIQSTSCHNHICWNIALICLNVTFLYTKLLMSLSLLPIRYLFCLIVALR